MRFFVSIILLFLTTLASPGMVMAHGGEDHGQAPAPQKAVPLTGLGFGADGDLFEMVITPTSDKNDLMIHLADLASNAPVENALITAEGPGSPPWQGTASPSDIVGIYWMASPPAHKGSMDLTLTVSAGEKTDLILITLPPATEDKPRVVEADPPAAIPVSVFMALAGIFCGAMGYALGWARRGKAVINLLLVMVLLALVGSGQSFAHGGEEHGEEQHPEAKEPSGGETKLAKSTQFLLGIRTVPAAPREAAATVRLVGRVIPDPSAYARVQPSLTARVSNDPNFPVPVSGQRVKRGEPLAALDPNLSANDKMGRQTALFLAQGGENTMGRELLLAPIDGVVTDVHIVPGEVVTEQTVLAEIVQPERLWVEAILFDLPLADRIRGAMAETRLLPGHRFRLNLVGASPKLSPEEHGLHLQFAVEETGGVLRLGTPLDVYAETETVVMPLAVPREALLEKEGQPLVWIKTAPEKFAARVVRTGRRVGAWVEILSGLQTGDKVVIQGGRQLAAIR